MKKIFYLLFILILITGCSKKEEETTDTKRIKSTGDLICGYKENRVDEKLYYSSLYQYKFDKNGYLTTIIDMEVIEFEEDDKKIKEDYKKELETALNDYKDKDGVKAEKSLDDKKYTMTITIDVDKLKEEDKENYVLASDRITAYKIFETAGYTCE
jgi:hypothetical protein